MPSGSRPGIESLRRYALRQFCFPAIANVSHAGRNLTSIAIKTCRMVVREMGVDVLVTGHTQKLVIWQGEEGGLYVNPGSVSSFMENAKKAPVICISIGKVNLLTASVRNGLAISITCLNPSISQATGAYTTTNPEVSQPSFILMDVQGSKVVTYSYVLDGEVRLLQSLI